MLPHTRALTIAIIATGLASSLSAQPLPSPTPAKPSPTPSMVPLKAPIMPVPLKVEGEGLGGPPVVITTRPNQTHSGGGYNNWRKCRLKDIAQVAGMNSHSLTGFGLVAGLPGSGDSQGALSSAFVVNLLSHYGMTLNPLMSNGMNKNVAVVAVTAETPPLSRSGDRIDVRVSSLGDAKSLDGGTLLSSLLYGLDGKIYASAQGPVGSIASTAKGSNAKPAAAGYVPAGATVSQNLSSPALQRGVFVWTLQQPDFMTARRVADVMNTRAGTRARATGPQTVEVQLTTMSDPVLALAELGELEIEVDRPARVVCDERSGTIVAGAEVRLHPATVSHRGMTIEISPQGATVKSLVDSLNKAGATPPDIISIIQALQQSGALNGEVIVR